uniref:Uncharacterized protein n=1 Tax=Helianthus annuus TaxID=4232 RepID=A0A251RU09_HELAN
MAGSGSGSKSNLYWFCGKDNKKIRALFLCLMIDQQILLQVMRHITSQLRMLVLLSTPQPLMIKYWLIRHR